jgi:hypothetical protein
VLDADRRVGGNPQQKGDGNDAIPFFIAPIRSCYAQKKPLTWSGFC